MKQEETLIKSKDEFTELAKQYPEKIEVHPRLRFEEQLGNFLRKHFKK